MEVLNHLTDEEKYNLNNSWRFWARDAQLPPEDWAFLWIILAGRGFGKTWVGANVTNEIAEKGLAQNIALVGRDAHDVRAFMIEGESGILGQAKNDFMPIYYPSKRVLEYPNGVTAHIYYAEEPKGIRGPNHGFAWCDEPASWQDAHLGISEDTAWSNLMFTMRKGEPKVVITGTPKPVKLIRQLMKLKNTVVTRGSTYDNVDNLAKSFFQNVIESYEGTRLGKQEISGEILDDNPSALWSRNVIHEHRVNPHDFDFDDLERIVVAIDPQAAGITEDEVAGVEDSTAKTGAETGIIVAGKRGTDYYVLEDASTKGQPEHWASQAIRTAIRWRAERIVAERNNGGEMVLAVLRAADECDDQISDSLDTVWASRGKYTRAEPISLLYERGRVHHVGVFVTLEDQMCYWDPSIKVSPDRLDSLVWALTYLSEGDRQMAVGTEDQYNEFFSRSRQ